MDNELLINKLLINIDKGMYNNLLSNSDLVQLIERAGMYLNLQTRSDYVKNNRISYNGAKNYRQNIKLFNVNFIIENK